MRIYLIQLFLITFFSCSNSIENKLIGKWECYKVDFSTSAETNIDTLNRQTFLFKENQTYEFMRWDLVGHGNWSLTKPNDSNYYKLIMISDQGDSAGFFINKLTKEELVFFSTVNVSGEIIKTEYYYHRILEGHSGR